MQEEIQFPAPKEPLFELGQLLITPNALDRVGYGEAYRGIALHVSGDWGDMCASDKKANDMALKTGERIFSAYHTSAGVKFWIITEADRSSTTVLMPEDY